MTTLLSKSARKKGLAPTLAALMMFGLIPDANAARAVVWRGSAIKTVIVKPTRVVTVKKTWAEKTGAKPVRVGSRSRHRHYYGAPSRRRHGHNYWGYGHYTSDSDAIVFLGLTALTLAILDHASEAQQRAHEQSIIEATRLPAGESITWNDGPQSGSVTVLRTGTAPNGQPCREFSQAVTIGGQSETAYGTACRQPDGAWKIIN